VKAALHVDRFRFGPVERPVPELEGEETPLVQDDEPHPEALARRGNQRIVGTGGRGGAGGGAAPRFGQGVRVCRGGQT